MKKQLIQLFGLDPDTRNDVAIKIKDELNAFYCIDRILPTASTESPYARWLRTVGSVAFRNGIEIYVASGYFPTKEARFQFKDGQVDLLDNKVIDPVDIFTVWIDTIDPQDSVAPEPPLNAPSDFKWEEPDSTEYDLRITKEDGHINAIVKLILHAWNNR